MFYYAAEGFKNAADEYVYIFFSPRDPSTGQMIDGWESSDGIAQTYLDVLQMTTLSGFTTYDLLVQNLAMTTPVLSAANYVTNNIFIKAIAKSTLIRGVEHAGSGDDYTKMRYDGPFLLIFKNDTGDASRFVTGIINMDYSEYIYNATKQLDWLRNDIENVLFPRSKRAIDLLGENLVLDNFTYDDASNITAFRMRLFETTSGAANATEDYTGSDMETGELLRYTVAQTYDTDRNLRSLHRSYIASDQADYLAKENTVSDTANAPGNTGTFPASSDIV